jgi:23S rRNA (cytosine1962-C5)-methyltransferase
VFDPLAVRGLNLTEPLPTVSLRSVSRHPHLYRKLIGEASPDAKAGDIVRVLTPDGELWGHGLYNPRAEITVRMLTNSTQTPDAAFWTQRLQRAVDLRAQWLSPRDAASACRLIHGEGDGFPGLVVDRFDDILSAEAFTLGMLQRSSAILEELGRMVGTRHTLVQVPAQTHGQEGFQAEPRRSPALPERVVIDEQGVKFEVSFGTGHKTGFFCDQRENRQRLASHCAGKRMLDVCCYSGGFAVRAAVAGKAASVTAVDLDEEAIAVARRNAKINGAKIQFTHADAFGYMRDLIREGKQYEVVVLDPPKLIRNRAEVEEGRRKYLDFNRLALQVVAPGGLLVTCSCSGLLGASDFLDIIRMASRPNPPRNATDLNLVPKTVQLLDRTGAGPDHPVAVDCPETEYLKAFWLRVL